MTTTGTLGNYLKQLRKNRSLSLGQLAVRAEVSKATLSRWESDTTFPRIPELRCVWEALEATPEQRTTCLRLLEAPRAIVAERDDPQSPQHFSLGNLLFGLRQRAGKSQAEIARAAGVSRSLYVQWENDVSRPEDTQLHAIGFALGASAEELVVLISNSLASQPIERSREALLAAYTQVASWDMKPEAYRLHLLTLLASVSWLYRQGKAGPGDVALLIGAFGSYACDIENDLESGYQLYHRARALAARSQQPLAFLFIPSLLSVLDAENNPRPLRERVSSASAWRSRFHSPEGEAYLLSYISRELAPFASDEALRLGERAYTLVDHDPHEYFCRLHDYGNLLRRCGKPAESVAFLTQLTPPDTFRSGVVQLNIAQGLRDMGARQEALTQMSVAREILIPYDLQSYQDSLNRLEASLS